MRLVLAIRSRVLDQPQLRAALRLLGRPFIRLALRMNPAPWVGPSLPVAGEPVLRLPLDYRSSAEPLSAVVLLHAYHVEVLGQIVSQLRSLPFPVDVIVTTDTEEKREAAIAAFDGWSLGCLEVRVTPNRGRNVAPQLVACRDAFERHELVLILHTKVSSHTDSLAGWREFLLRDLIGTPAVAQGVMEAFARLPKLGVLAPRTFPEVRRHMIWGENYGACSRLAERLGFSLYPDSPLDFPAGFMFWARTAALKPLLDLDLGWDDFEPEAGQKDGTLAHALERLIFHACERSGHRWVRAGVQQGVESPEAFYSAWSPRTLARALTDRGRRVLLQGPPPEPTAGTGAETIQTAPNPKTAFREACQAELDDFLAGGERLSLPTSETPVVSILLVLFNQAELTYTCLRALRRALDAPCEVILADNASSDQTAELLDRIDGARVVRNAENLHFLRGVNAAAELARGRHLLLLNNDTRLAAGSIAAAVERLEAEADLGAVGGRIILLDGKLQEAGSIIWKNGHCLGYGRGRDPWAAEFQFRRDVDYCSGAFLMMRRDLFERLGRFDPAFAPAYYEETDLCMRIREAGLRIGYDPRIQLSHFEFGSSTTSDSALALQAAHLKLFQQRHAGALKTAHLPPETSLIEARMRDDVRGRLLIVEDQIPYPQMGAGYPRALEILRAAVEAGWFVTFYPLVYSDVDYDEAYRILPPGVEIAADRGAEGLVDFMRERPEYYDAALVSRPHNMKPFREALAEEPRFLPLSQVIYDAEAVFALRDEARARLDGEPLKPAAADPVEAELALTESVASVLAVNAAEAEVFRSAGVLDVRVLGHALEPRPTGPAFEDRRDLLFVGALDDDVSPNVDSLEFFVREVAPRLDGLIGAGWRLRVAGRCGAARAQALGGERVELLGRVEDLTGLYAQSRVFIAPTRYAAGIPMKVHEAAAMGLPSAVTSLLARQLGWTDGVALTVGDAPEDFARACQRLYEDAALWEAVRAGALARIQAECAPASFAATLGEALDAAAGRQAAISSSSLRMSATGEATPPSRRMTLLQ